MNVGRMTFSGLKKFVEDRVRGPFFDNLLKGIKVVSAEDGNCVCELKVQSGLINAQGVLHGGATATLVDAVSSYALTTKGSGRIGTSIDLSTSYMRPAKLGETLTVTADTISYGRNLAHLSVAITNKETGKLIAQGKHIKFVGEYTTS